MGHSSDPAVFDNIFVENELGFWNNVSGPVNLVIDLGANIGCASVLFLNVFPDAFVLAVEPDPANFELCRHNLAAYGDRVKVIQAAVWHSCGKLALSRGTFGDGRDWATEVREANEKDVADVIAYDMPTLLGFCPSKEIDLLKIDIEGGERALFSKLTDNWLGQVRNICVELHGRDCHAALISALAEYEYTSMQSGEYMVCLNVGQKGNTRLTSVGSPG
jgi:FkbM family methyltransferase